MIDETKGSEAIGNHEQFHTVRVYAAEGSQFGVLKNSDGVLELVVKREKEDGWPHGKKPDPGTTSTIMPGYKCYVVMINS